MVEFELTLPVFQVHERFRSFPVPGSRRIPTRSFESPAMEQLGRTKNSYKNRNDQQHLSNAKEVGHRRSEENRYEGKRVGNGIERRVDARSHVLVGPLLKNGLGRNQHKRVAESENCGEHSHKPDHQRVWCVPPNPDSIEYRIDQCNAHQG